MDPDFAARPDRLAPDFSARRSAGGALQDRAVRPERRRRGERPDARSRRNRLAAQLTLVAAVWSLGLVIAAVALPVYNTTTVSNAAGTTLITTTLVAGQGAWVLIPVLIPLVITGVVALALRRKRAGAGASARPGRIAWTAVGLLAAFALFSILSIGGFVIPVALLLAGATKLSAPPRRAVQAADGTGAHRGAPTAVA